MELKITSTLQFNLVFVTAFHFTGYYLNANHLTTSGNNNSQSESLLSSPTSIATKMYDNGASFPAGGEDDGTNMTHYSYVVNSKLEAMTLYFLDMSLLIPEFVNVKKSLIAASAVYIARAVVGVEVWSDAMEYYTGYSVHDIGKHRQFGFDRDQIAPA
mmetsp:Transcript_7143/g.10899  ORF Transcript_7143/g.10899 Transcript_7143/m.10899 type:complete len:158 (+) Transcript_7143:534-1007(+)